MPAKTIITLYCVYSRKCAIYLSNLQYIKLDEDRKRCPRQAKMIDYYEPKLDLTLLGCGFLGECLPGFFGGFRGAPEHRWRARRLGAAVGGDGRFVGVREREWERVWPATTAGRIKGISPCTRNGRLSITWTNTGWSPILTRDVHLYEYSEGGEERAREWKKGKANQTKRNVRANINKQS